MNFSDVCNCLVKAVRHLVQELPLTDLGAPVEDMVQRITFQPVISPSQIRGAVIYIDHFDNVTVNITRELFERVGRGRQFQLYFRRHDPITKLSTHYNDVPIGETLCLFNSDYLELSINMGKAAEMLGLKIEDTVQIDFMD
ncbi:MAG: SAM-dependent chlorinase/fluorinase [Saprospiraceae bacterium]|nr:SAM-dependent chlorinase/fluorinase [Saprospiraceae bacterium]